MNGQPKSQGRVVLEREDLQRLLDVLQADGYRTVGPTVRQGAIVYDDLKMVDQLPIGWTEEQAGGRYALRAREDKALFGHTVGPQSWKRFLFPPVQRLFRAQRAGRGFQILSEPETAIRFAFIGVRACDLRAMLIQDEVFLKGQWADPLYRQRREAAFIVAVNCDQPGGTCFCASMGAGPAVERGFDLALTEVLENGRHFFVMETGSPRGAEMVTAIPHHPATPEEVDAAEKTMRAAAGRMGRSLDRTDLERLLLQHLEHPRWNEIAARCLSCANCTLVCPTCFCSTVEDRTDLTGAQAERWRQWDSCFTGDFTQDYEYVALRHPDEYAFNEGRLVSNRGLDIAVRQFDDHFVEEQVPHSTALQSSLKRRGAYCVGPIARYSLNFDKLTPTVQEAARAAGLGPVCRNPFQSIIVRALETLYACEEALRIVAQYEPPAEPAVKVQPRAGFGHGCTEAPRGILYHRYRIDDLGVIHDARIVPPTAQNQKTIESDLRHLIPGHLDLPAEKLQWRCEQAIRNYDPCISCATHSLKLQFTEGDERS